MENKELHKGGRASARRPRRSQEELLQLGRRISAVLDLIGDRKSAAEIAGKSVDQLGAYAKGENEPPFRVLAKLATAAGVHLDWLATGEEPMIRRSGSATIVSRQPIFTGPRGYKSSEGGATFPPPGMAQPPAESGTEQFDRSALLACLRRYFEVLGERERSLTPDQKARLFLFVYENFRRIGRFDESLMDDALDLLS